MAELRIYSVTLAFTPPGPLHTSLVIAQDEANASAMAMQHAMGNLPIVTPLATVLAIALDPDVLRQMLRAIEGRGPGEVVSLVPKGPSAASMFAEQRAAEILRKHEPAFKPCRHYPDYPNCTCDPVSCVMLRSTANPAGLESLTGGSLLGGALDAADASTFTGRNVDRMWNRKPPLHYWGEEYGPPWPGGAA